MVNHPNRGRKFNIVSGQTLTAGRIEDFAPTRFYVASGGDGQFYPYDPDMALIDKRDGPVVLDMDGLLIIQGAAAGYGFLPEAGEMERLAALGVRIPAETDDPG